MTSRPAPLEGLRVLDFSRVLAGPFATALLADAGAEVIKIEPPGGDDYRHIGPFKEGESALFMLVNRGKKSVVLDLKAEAGAALARRLAAAVDVVVENYKPGVAARLGVDYETLAAHNARLVYASVSGFGQSGPLAARPAYDLVVQAMSGWMDVTGEADGPPMRVGESVGDLCAGLYAAWGIMAGLYGRERSGRGTHVDVAMFDALFSLLPTAFAQLLFSGAAPRRVGNRHPLSTPFGSFAARDGHVIIAVANDALFARLAEAMGRADLAGDTRFAHDEDRTRHEPVLRGIVEAWTGARTVDEVLAVLDAHAVPAAPIWSVAQAVESAQTAFRGLLASARHPVAGDIRVAEQPVHFTGVERGRAGRSPLLGEHTEAVLREVAGIDDARLDELARSGIIA